VKIFFIGDIIGKPGRRAVREKLPGLLEELHIDLVLANGENAAGGFGVTPKIVKELINSDIDLLTSGNHIWDKRDILGFLDNQKVLLRPANYPNGVPGRGSSLVEAKNGIMVGVINVSGRVFMDDIECPFKTSLKENEKLRAATSIVIVDFHAEATSEKEALGWYLDGKVSAVVGTHTHVQTADERVLPNGTAYITDLGMTGAMDSVIGIEKSIAIERFLTGLPKKFETAQNDVYLQGALITVDEASGRATDIERMNVKA
jgi:metallophosphoesterase (TIGR00282 family)